MHRLAIMANVANPANVSDMKEIGAAAQAVGIDVGTFEIRRTEDIAPAFARLKGATDALYIPPDALISTNRVRINTFALAQHLPTLYGAREFVEGGLALLRAELSRPVPTCGRLCR
jgi:ABC-type uncharacterized transport system substrate-binding protein